MKGLDTSVVVRYLTQDEPVQARKATQVIEEDVNQEEICDLTSIVLCELTPGAYARGTL